MLNILLTVDTEFWPRRAYHRNSDYEPDFERDIYGVTAHGEFGLRYQLDLLNAHGLRAVFFVEPLCAYAVGDRPVQEVVQEIQDAGHEVQLHLHPEWLKRMPDPILPGRREQFLHRFESEEQTLLVNRALEKLTNCGARRVCAFRAGSYGANFVTLRALAENGIRYDSSHNTAYLGTSCLMATEPALLQPRQICGVWEFPISYVRDFAGRARPLQLASCSYGELTNGLTAALEQRWYCIVIVSHTFEFIRGRLSVDQAPKPDRIAIRRFERLCRFLSENRDKFRTSGFSDLPSLKSAVHGDVAPLRAGITGTSVRLCEQFLRRLAAAC